MKMDDTQTNCFQNVVIVRDVGEEESHRNRTGVAQESHRSRTGVAQESQIAVGAASDRSTIYMLPT